MRRVGVCEVSKEWASDYLDFDILTTEGPVYMGHHEGVVVFLAGVVDLNPGCGEVWVKYHVDPEEFPAAWIEIKKLFCHVFDLHNYRRFQSHVLAGSVSVGFNRHLGMVEEGTMRKYVDENDYIMMARVR